MQTVFFMPVIIRLVIHREIYDKLFSISKACCTGERMTKYTKIRLKTLLICFLFLTQGCQILKKEIVYPYPDSQKVIVTAKQFGALQIGLTEAQVFQLTNGMCTLVSESGQTGMKTYGCNGKGKPGANVVLIFLDGRLNVRTQFGLE